LSVQFTTEGIQTRLRLVAEDWHGFCMYEFVWANGPHQAERNVMRYQLLAAAAALVVAVPASAAINFSFDPGDASPSAGFTVIDTFDNLGGVTVTGNPALVLIKNPPADSAGAPPANSLPPGTSYLSVLGGGSATINFGPLVKAFQFDWGSIDSYNTLTINSRQGSFVVVPGGNFPNQANGDQFLPNTNGLFTVTRTGSDRFTSITLTSNQNSFEIDNLAVSYVPEPATWAMLIAGFGLVGMAARRRRTIVSATA